MVIRGCKRKIISVYQSSSVAQQKIEKTTIETASIAGGHTVTKNQ